MSERTQVVIILTVKAVITVRAMGQPRDWILVAQTARTVAKQIIHGAMTKRKPQSIFELVVGHIVGEKARSL